MNSAHIYAVVNPSHMISGMTGLASERTHLWNYICGKEHCSASQSIHCSPLLVIPGHLDGSCQVTTRLSTYSRLICHTFYWYFSTFWSIKAFQNTIFLCHPIANYIFKFRFWHAGQWRRAHKMQCSWVKFQRQPCQLKQPAVSLQCIYTEDVSRFPDMQPRDHLARTVLPGMCCSPDCTVYI